MDVVELLLRCVGRRHHRLLLLVFLFLAESLVVDGIAGAEVPRHALLPEKPAVDVPLVFVELLHACRIQHIRIPHAGILYAHVFEQRCSSADAHIRPIERVFRYVVVARECEVFDEDHLLQSRDGVFSRRHLYLEVVAEAVCQPSRLLTWWGAVDAALIIAVFLLHAVAVDVR